MESSKPTKLSMQIGAYVVWDGTTAAEITQALKMIDSDYSRKSADVYGKMFEDTVVKNFSFKQTNFAYFLTEALGPYFQKMILD